jgi:hypothetical protein
VSEAQRLKDSDMWVSSEGRPHFKLATLPPDTLLIYSPVTSTIPSTILTNWLETFISSQG